jgi:Ca2+-binding EF-hand superfamily protein
MFSSVASKFLRTIRPRAPALRLSSTAAYTDKDLERFKEAFRARKSYQNGSIVGADLPGLIKAIGYTRTDAQSKKYVEYVEEVFGGRLELKDFIDYMRTQHDPAQILLKYAQDFDKDKDGFISAEEFKYGIGTLEIHDPSVKTGSVSYEDLLREADSNNDGKISIEELAAWLKTKQT